MHRRLWIDIVLALPLTFTALLRFHILSRLHGIPTAIPACAAPSSSRHREPALSQHFCLLLKDVPPISLPRLQLAQSLSGKCRGCGDARASRVVVESDVGGRRAGAESSPGGGEGVGSRLVACAKYRTRDSARQCNRNDDQANTLLAAADADRRFRGSG